MNLINNENNYKIHNLSIKYDNNNNKNVYKSTKN